MMERYLVCVSELNAPGEGYKEAKHWSTWYGMTVLVTEGLQEFQTRLVTNGLPGLLVYKFRERPVN